MDFFKILKGGVGVGMSNFDRLFAERYGGGAWQLTTLTGTLPLSFKSKGTPLTDYKLYGTSEGAGEETENLFFGKGKTLNLGAISVKQFIESNMQVSPGETYWINASSALYSRLGFYMNDTRSSVSNWISTQSIIAIPDDCNNMYVEVRNYAYDAVTDEQLATATEIMLVKGSTQPPSYIPYGYKLPMTVESGEESTTTPIYIGDSKLMGAEYVNYGEQKIYRLIGGVLTPTDPPVALPELSTYQGENTLSCSEALGESSITGYIKGV